MKARVNIPRFWLSSSTQFQDLKEVDEWPIGMNRDELIVLLLCVRRSWTCQNVDYRDIYLLWTTVSQEAFCLMNASRVPRENASWVPREVDIHQDHLNIFKTDQGSNLNQQEKPWMHNHTIRRRDGELQGVVNPTKNSRAICSSGEIWQRHI